MNLSNGEILIHDGTVNRWRPNVDGNPVRGGAVPRDFSVQPIPMMAVDIPLIPETEWSERVRDKVASQSQLSDIRLRGANGQPIVSYDQNGQGFCWAYSTTAATTLTRAAAGMPHVRLSAHGVACKVKNFQDEGGWGALSLEFIQKNGVPPESAWPAKSMSRQYDTQAVWAEAAKYKVSETWVDLAAQVYDRNLTFNQVATLLLTNQTGPLDFNWWGHSVCGLDLVDGASQRMNTRRGDGKLPDLAEFEAAWGLHDPVTKGYGFRIWNSWTDSWSDRGMGVLAGSKTVPDGAAFIATALAA